MLFNKKVVWITGASSGIGAELAVQFAQLKATLILTARNESSLKKIQDTCLQHTHHCAIFLADLSIQDNAEQSFKDALQQFGRIDIVILNAGVSQRSFAIETKLAVYRSLMEINFFSNVAICNHLLPYFNTQKQGHIVAISSMAGLMGFPQRSGYAAAKHALKGYIETLQTENNNEQVYFTLVSPGRINTPISMSALTKDGTAHQKYDEGQLQGIPVNDCAKKIINAIVKKRKHIIIARQEKWLWYIKWFVPFLYFKIAHKTGMDKQA